ncbi:rho guanine nucleotide exchange factor 11 isoform X2 [Electrophorus electricus]|uniref:rho guanine nucleotide exchange factor 11 isoform X2 n=1 Tax=Electrophorus electricus TaxID=8005 RepID=UPI0015D05DC2|nr:rho guanine nucleotide exchange factor 11 isoform X2 [Electrophorus electricus]
MNVRPPASTLDRLSSFTVGDFERKTSLGQQREPLADLPTEAAGLVQRCVVVQRDSLGFGFTVCGERIKLVQNVRPGGAAVKAGVHEGDRIIKVNGSLVSSMSHQEVVKMIKSGTYVALTLQGPPPSVAYVPLQPLTDVLSNQSTSLGGEAPPPPPPPLPPTGIDTPTQRITGPKPLQDPEVQKHAAQILRKMLEQEEAELQDLLEEQSRNPSPSLEERIESAKRRANQVRVKFHQDLDGTHSESVVNYVIAGEGRLSIDSGEGEFEACESPFSSPSSLFRTPRHHRHSSDTHAVDSGSKAHIIGPEEEEEEDDCYTINEMDGPFQDIELLKSRPAHMAVFMRYIFSQLLDPNPLLFYLSVEAYLGSSPKDARTLAPQICSHFLDPDAPLKIKVRDEYLSDIESRLHAQEDIRGPLSELQQQVLPEIQDQIQDYRNKQLMGLGSLFGESDLQQLDGDPAKERQVVDRQVAALWELLSKHEEEKSSLLASTVHLYLRHTGIKLRDSKVFPGLSTEKEKWLAFFPKTKKPLSGMKKEKDGDDKKRNPILKYIGKPRSVSQSTFHVPLSPTEVRSGSVRNIIQHFENHTDSVGEEGEKEGQRLSTGSLGDDSMDSPTVSVRLARSESLKAQGEGRRRGGAAGVETVPRSRSDVDMEDCDERESTGLRPLHHSASSSASSSSARSLENPTPPYTPRSRRRSIDTPLALLPDAPPLEEDTVDCQNWQETVEPHTLASLSSREIERQAVIYELFTTEASHLRTLRVLDQVFFQKMRNLLTIEELSCIFPNLPQVYSLHANLCESMKRLRDSPIVQGIGDIMVSRFEDAAGEEFQEQVSHLCSQQSQALELIKNKRKDPRFAHLIQECEASPHCRRLQLKDLLVSEMQRLTKYPLLLDNIIRHTEAGSPDLQPLLRAQVCCRGILRAVNEVVRETEHRQLLSHYQRRLDLSPLERQASPVAAQFKNLDLTTKKMIHEGPLTWKVSKDKAIDIHALLLSDLLVLLQRGPDDRLILRCPARSLGGVGGGNTDLKTPFCPVVRLDSSLVRSVATDNKALYVISTSERQIYELVAGTSSEKNIWKNLLEKTISSASGGIEATKQGSTAPSAVLRLHGNHVGRLDGSLTEESGSIERDSQSDDEENVLTPTIPTDQSEAYMHTGGQGYVGGQAKVADAALEDVKTLRLLILGDLEDGWSQDSDDTPTNETANERNPFRDRPGIETAEPSSDETYRQLVEDQVDAPPVEVVRKAMGAGSSSIPDDMFDVTCNQSSESKGNTFYLVLPKDQMSLLTEESSTDDSSALEAASQKQKVTSLSSQQEGQEMPCQSPKGHAHLEMLSHETRPCQSRASIRQRMIKNVDGIFQTMEGLMKKLHQLREIEADHCRLLTMVRKKSPVSQSSDDTIHGSSSIIRTPSIYLGSSDGNEEGPTEPAQPEIHSTGF